MFLALKHITFRGEKENWENIPNGTEQYKRDLATGWYNGISEQGL